jgi:hypothetical protein
MIITTTTMFILQAIIIGAIIWTTPEDCPRKYRVLQENGGVLTSLGQIHEYCVLDYGHKWKLKEKKNE